MKIAKPILIFFFLISLNYSCTKKEGTDDKSKNEIPTEATFTISEFIEQYGSGIVTDNDVVIRVSVISSDEGKNIRNEIFLRDDDQALRIKIDANNLYESYPAGTEILLSCTNLKLDTESRTLTNKNGNALQTDDVEKHLFKTGEVNTKSAKNYIPSQIGNQDLNLNFYAHGYQFDESEIGKSYIRENQTTIHTLSNSNGDQIKILLNPGSSFDGLSIPEKQGLVYGILVKENTEFVLQPGALSDLNYTSQRTPPFEKRTFAHKGNTLPYQIMFPRDYDNNGSYPLVIFLHGSGERGNNNTSQMAFGPKPFGSYDARTHYPAIVIFPQCPSDIMWSRRAKYDENGKLIFEFPVEQNPNYAMEMVIELVNSLISTEAVDDKRIYVSGLSMGGIGVFEFCYYAPDLPAAAISIAGGHDSSFVSNYAANIDFRLYHGDNDNVVPPRYSREMYTALQQNGFQAEYFEAPGRGHEWNYVLNDPDYIAWMFNQRRL